MPSTAATDYLEMEWRRRDFPLLRDLTHYTVRERWLESADTYARVALDTAHASPFAASYLVDENTIDDLENLKRYERLWATIPAAWTEYRSVGFDYPGFIGTYGNPGSIVSSGVTAAPDATSKLLVITKTAHGLTTANYVQYFVTIISSGLTACALNGYSKIVATTTDTFTVKQYVNGFTFSGVSYRTIDGVPNTNLRSITPNARILHEYALPGVTTGITTAADFQPLPELKFLDATGAPVVALTGATLPTNAEWIAAAQAGSYFVKDSAVDTYLGNILERITTLLPYRL